MDTSGEIIESLLFELDTKISATKPNDTFWENFAKLKIWKFPDGYFSIEELGDERMYDQRLLLFDTLDVIKAQLVKAGYILSDKSLSDFTSLGIPIQNRYQAVIKYIRRHEELIKVLNLRVGNAEFNHSDRIEIVKTLAKKLSDEKEDRINKLRVDLYIFFSRKKINE